jgi:uncharacterized repeat protein (TIGR01451 family)
MLSYWGTAFIHDSLRSNEESIVKAARTVLFLCVVVGVTLKLVAVQAATIPVACDPDALVAAITTANSNNETDTLTLAADCVYTLTKVDNLPANSNGLPEITSPFSLEIEGNGAILERSQEPDTPPFRIFFVREGVLTLRDLTIRNGRTVDGLAQRLTNGRNAREGGGIHNTGSLTLINCTVSGNVTGNGADSDRGEGGEGGEGGGIFNQGFLLLINSTISGNTTGHGGSGESGVGVGGGEGGFGGGLSNSNDGKGGTAVLINSTVSGNTTGDGGNGIAISKGGLGGDGGGINNHSQLTIVNSTITDNTVGKGGIGGGGNGSAGKGGGIRIAGDSPVTLHNSIVATQRRGKDCEGVDPVVYSYTLDSDNSCNPLSPPGAPLPPPVRLGPLQKNGGLTQTHPLLCGSPAIDAGDPAGCTDADGNLLLTDQRGVSRPQRAACDIGAFEVQTGADLALTQKVVPSLVGAGQPLTYTFTVINQGPDAATEVALQSSLPLGEASVMAVHTSQGQCSAVGALSCTLGALACGQSATVEVELVASESGELHNTAVAQSIFPVDPVLDNNTHTEVVRVGSFASLTLPSVARVVVEFLTAPPTVQQAVITDPSLVSNGNIASSGCNKTLSTDFPGTLLVNAKASQPGCRVVLDAKSATKEIEAFPAGATLTFSDLVGWENVQIIERHKDIFPQQIFQITWSPPNGAGNEGPLSIVVRFLNSTCDSTLFPGCNSLDADGDGLWDDWERFSIDTDGDGVANLHLPEADPAKPDIFVQIDYMDCGVSGGDCEAGDDHSHKPKKETIDAVVEAFMNGGVNRGSISLHLDVDQAIPHDQFLPFASDFGKDFSVVKDQYFDRDRSFAYHYGLFIHQLRNGATVSGQAEKLGNDFVIAFGGWNMGGEKDIDDDGQRDADVGTVLQQAGALMHELGHNLGLDHGGGDSFNHKPNYPSVMNYTFQLTGIASPEGASPAGAALAKLTYSDGQNGTLNEKKLEETTGLCIGCTPFATRYVCPYNSACPVPIEEAVATVRTASSAGPIDWNCNEDPTDSGIITDINGDCKKDSSLKDFDDWSNLRMDFQSSPAFANDGSSSSGVLEEELDTVALNTWLTSVKDSFMREGAGNTNEGENPFLLIQPGSQAVIGFDLSHIPSPGVTFAKLRLTLAQAPRNANEVKVQVYRLDRSFSFAEGKDSNWGNHTARSRNSDIGEGVTWKCASDAEVGNQQADCDAPWDGGNAAIVSLTGEVSHPRFASAGTGVELDVTADVQAAISEGATELIWLLKKGHGPGQIVYHSRQRALAEGDVGLAPSLFLKFSPEEDVLYGSQKNRSSSLSQPIGR